jgi:hypothetical protein
MECWTERLLKPLKLTTYRDSEIDEKTIQLLKVKKSYFKLIKKKYSTY